VAGASAGLLNQAIDLELSELHDGHNRIELQAAGTWTGSYRVTVTGAVDLGNENAKLERCFLRRRGLMRSDASEEDGGPRVSPVAN
jgi:hypothetical protein